MAQSTAEELSHQGAAGNAGGAHDGTHGSTPFLAHHFDSPRHQFEAGKLGIWIFLTTEVLFFGGLFCAYAIYRGLHPEIFIYAHYYLDTFWGAVNTCVLIVSSLTAAWAVRNAQLGEQKKLVFNIIATVLLACCFLCVKYVEYAHKFHDEILPGRYFNPKEEVWELESYKKKHGEHGGHAEQAEGHPGAVEPAAPHAAPPPPVAPSAGTAAPVPAAPSAGTAAPVPVAPSAGTAGPVPVAPGAGTAAPVPGAPTAGTGAPVPGATTALPAPAGGAVAHAEGKQAPPGALARPRHASVFFSIYFFMTGLHGVHVIAGIITWLWILRRALRGEFGPQHFGAVDYTALYWHLVDLIWIYLFPLLYLIH